MITRRELLGGLGALTGALALGVKSAHAAPSAVIMWQLDPAWGTPIATSSGHFRTRCSGRACHLAAPHRWFLTQADALAGRLHPCCLAQPVQVEVTLDLNALMPFYQARFGGVDDRCPQLTPAVITGLATSRPFTGSVSVPTPTSPPEAPVTGGRQQPIDDGQTPHSTDPLPTFGTSSDVTGSGQLPVTGAGQGLAKIAAVTTVLGGLAVLGAQSARSTTGS